jgi:WD40 repeat protein
MSGRAVTAIAGHPTHELAAAGYDDGCIVLADLGKGREMMIKHADAAAVTALAWSPAGDFLAAASDDEALLFDFTTLTQRAPR